MKRIIISIILSLLLSLIVFFNTTYDGLIAKIFGFGVLEIESGSMENTLSVSDIIVIKECESYDVGDIITYQVNNNYLVTHRIIEKKGNGFVTKGDSNNAEDRNIVTKDNIEGKLICNSKLLRFIYEHLLVIIIVVFLLIILL